MTKINNMMHQETPYKTIQRTKYIVQVLVCKLAAMSEKNSVCIFCNEGSTSSEDCDSSSDSVAAQVGITSSFANFPPLGIRVCTEKRVVGISGVFTVRLTLLLFTIMLLFILHMWIIWDFTAVVISSEVVSKCPGVVDVF